MGFGFGCFVLGVAAACLVLPSASHAEAHHVSAVANRDMGFNPPMVVPLRQNPATEPQIKAPSSFLPRASRTSIATNALKPYGGYDPKNPRAAPQNGASTLVAKSPTQITVQGGSLRTWNYRSPNVNQLQVVLNSEGRPLDADVELWHGPDNTPFKMRVYSENGDVRPFSAVLETPRGPNTVAIRNIGQLEFPFFADVANDDVDQPSGEALSQSTLVQGGALRTFPFDPSVDSVEILLTTDGRPLNARIELLQGPNNNKQVIELYAEDGRDRQFFGVIETPGSGNVIRIVNTAPLEFPMRASVVPHSINTDVHPGAIMGGDDVVIGGGAAM
jgi:hypothetical protein